MSRKDDYSEVLVNFPKYFTEENLSKLNSAIKKWDQLKNEFSRLEDAIANEAFSLEEIEGLALWKSVSYFGETCTGMEKGTSKSFSKILSRFIEYYQSCKE